MGRLGYAQKSGSRFNKERAVNHNNSRGHVTVLRHIQWKRSMAFSAMIKDQESGLIAQPMMKGLTVTR